MKLLPNGNSKHKMFCFVIFFCGVTCAMESSEIDEYPLGSLLALTDYNEQENSLLVNDSVLADLKAINAKLAAPQTASASMPNQSSTPRAMVQENVPAQLSIISEDSETKKTSAKRKRGERYCCSACVKKFDYSSNGHKHVNIHHRDVKGAGLINARSGDFIPTRFFSFQCPDCFHKPFFIKKSYNDHLKKRHNKTLKDISLINGLVENSTSSPEQVLNLSSEEAELSEVSEDIQSLTENERDGTRCTWKGCNKIISANMKRHLFTHTKVNPFRCSKCKKGFRQPGNGHRHVNIHHHGSKGAGIINLETGKLLLTKFVSFQCPDCEREPFHDRYSYQRHVETKHNKKLINRHYERISIKREAYTEESEEEAMSDLYSDDTNKSNSPETSAPVPPAENLMKILNSSMLAFKQRCFDFEITAIKRVDAIEKRLALLNQVIIHFKQEVSAQAIKRSLISELLAQEELQESEEEKSYTSSQLSYTSHYSIDEEYSDEEICLQNFKLQKLHNLLSTE